MSYKGNDSFTTMKGFMGDFTVKGDGHEIETMPPMPEGDVTESAELDNALPGGALSAANIKPTDNKTGAPTTTMDDELNEVADKAVQDVAEGYDADVQNLPGPGDREKKGYEAFNEMVAKGAAVHVQPFNRYDVDGSMNAIQKAADSAFSMGSENLTPWMTKGLDNDLTLKHMGLGMTLKGDPEDMGLEDGYEEDGAPNGEVEEADDDTESTQGENEEKPQTVAAAADDGEGDSANPAWLGDDGTQKGWDAYNRGMATKGFDLTEKGVERALWTAGDVVGQGLLKAGGKIPSKYGGALLTTAGRRALRNRKALGGVVAGAGTLGAAGAGKVAYDKGKEKGFDDGMTVFKGASASEMVMKSNDPTLAEERAILNPKGKFKDGSLSKRAWDAIKRGGKAVGSGASKIGAAANRNIGKVAMGLGAAGVAGAYAAGRSKKKGFDDGMTIFKGQSATGVILKGDWGFDPTDKSEYSPSQQAVVSGEADRMREIKSRHRTGPNAPKAVEAAVGAAEKPGLYRRAANWVGRQSTGRKVGAGLGAAALLGGGAYLASRGSKKKGFDGTVELKGCGGPAKIAKKKRI